MKKFVKLYLHSSYIAQISFQFDDFFTENSKFQFREKNLETLFTFELNSAELLSI